MAAKSKKKNDKARAKRAVKRASISGGVTHTEVAVEESGAPYGYDKADDGTLTGVDAELEVVATMRELAEKRLSITAIAAKLNQGEQTCRGAAWDAKMVSRVLRRKYVKPPRKAIAGRS